MVSKTIMLSWVGVSLVVSSTALAATIHVVPGGSDADTGTQQRPLATVAKARDVARAQGGAGHTILLAPGRYFHTEPIVLDDRDSGLTIRGAEPGAAAELYGGVPVTGWERWKGAIWRAPVPRGGRFFNLIVDGKPATMAQTPDAGSGFRGAARRHGNDGVVVPPEWRAYDYADAQVCAFLGADWFSEMREVLDASPDADGVLRIDPGSAMWGGMNDRFFLRGVLEFLNEPGEWCLKHEDGFVYYWPETGAPGDHLVVRPTVERLVEVRGRSPGQTAKGIRIQNLSLVGSDFCERWYIFGHGEDGSTPERLQQGLVFGENVEGLSVRDCRILAAGHSGVWLNHHARDCVVESCLVQGAGFAGVYANGYRPGEGAFASGPESDVNRGHRIENNFIYDCGTFIGGGCGIQFYQAGDSLIARNEIGEMPRYGISFKSIHWNAMPKTVYGHALTFDDHYDYIHTRDLRVTGNEVYSVCRNSFDFGAIESWGVGRDNLWAGNHLHDIDQTLDWNGWAHVLFADDASDWMTIRDNLIHHCRGGGLTGAFMLKSIEQAIENNLVADCELGRLVTFEPYILPAWNMSIRHNIFTADGVNSRYGAVGEASIHGKAIDGVPVPEGAGGFREVNHNWIHPRDPSNPNPLRQHGMDLDSIFGPAPVARTAPFWAATAADYVVTNRPAWFEPLPVDTMGLREDFPFDTRAATRRAATRKIQAEGYQRARILRTSGGTGIYNLLAGAWARYANLDFGAGVSKAVFQLDGPPADADPVDRYIRRYGDTLIEAVPFTGDMSVETVTQWEVSQPYRAAGKSGPALFDAVFAPETDPAAGEWSMLLSPATSKGGATPAKGVVDFDVIHGEGLRDACAYARAAIRAQSGRTSARMTIETTGGAKVWFNGRLVLSANAPGIHAIDHGVINAGWNTVLVKVNQLDGPGGFSFRYGTVASSCGIIAALPGLPEAAEASGTYADTMVELRLDAPEGPVIGRLERGHTECPIANASGIRDLYMVFPSGGVKSVDWLRFEE